MESLSTDPIFEFPPNILEYIRTQYNLDQPERIEEAVDILCDWLQKQDHLVKKNYAYELQSICDLIIVCINLFSLFFLKRNKRTKRGGTVIHGELERVQARDYLERIVINCKGSVERTKKKLDKLCTYRTLLPRYFEEFELRKNPALENIIDAFLPNMTDDYNRVYLLRNSCKKFDFTLLDTYRNLLLKCEYFQSRDYCNGIIVVLDFSEINMMEYLKVLNFAEMEQTLSILTEGYATRIKGIHIITNSKLVDTLVTLIKKAISPKLSQRIHIHKNIESIYDFVPKKIMPADYGGKGKSLRELSDQFMDVITSEPFKSFIEEMRKACTNESLRHSDVNAECMGVPGSFRKLTVD